MLSSSIILSEYVKILAANDVDDEDLGVQIAFPRFQEDLISKLLDETLSILKDIPLIYNLKSDIYVVGDIHGNIRDLLRILKKVNFIDSGVKILFLGDYVDRGEFSVEVITLLLSLLIQYPDRIFLLRGNHEFSSVNATYGFKEQIVNAYGTSYLWEQFNVIFNWLPIAAIINNRIFCIHGGISPHLKNIGQINDFKRPITSFQDSKLLADLMWSDPSSNINYFLHSERGYGCVFGSDAIIEFCRSQKMDQVIRAHQCVNLGIENQLHGKVLTVFSCSNYCDTCQNQGGFLYIGDQSMNSFELLPLNNLKRDSALFKDSSKKGALDVFDSTENLPLPNINMYSNGFNTGLKNPSRKLAATRRKSSFTQSFSRPLPIPLSALHMMSSEQLSLNQSSPSLTKSSQSLNIIQNNDHPTKLSKKMNCKIAGSQIFNNNMIKSSMPPLKQNLSSLPSISENLQETPVQIENSHLLPLYPNQ